MADLEIRLLKEADISAFPLTGPRLTTVQGWSVWQGGKLVGIAGVSISRQSIIAFSDFTPEFLFETPKITLWRLTLKLWDNTISLGYKIMSAVADERLPGAAAFLKRLGFEYYRTTERGEVYRWAS